ncbi:hypothetical protein RCJ22_18505, partial [Vibrio sp. FNV 38]|nr:hypothetical protein [Vibrio sp. FNV 38]
MKTTQQYEVKDKDWRTPYEKNTLLFSYCWKKDMKQFLILAASLAIAPISFAQDSFFPIWGD